MLQASVATRWPRRVRDRSGANSLLDCPNNERSPSKPHSPVNHAVHAGGCRRHHRLGHRGCTDRSPIAGTSARITEMTSGSRRRARERIASCREGCTEAILAAHGFPTKLLVKLGRRSTATNRRARPRWPPSPRAGGGNKQADSALDLLATRPDSCITSLGPRGSRQKRGDPFGDAAVGSIEPAERRRGIDLKAEPFSGRCPAQVDPCYRQFERRREGAAAIHALHRQVDLAPAHCGTLTFAVSVIICLRYEFANVHIVTDDVHTVIDPSSRIPGTA